MIANKKSGDILKPLGLSNEDEEKSMYQTLFNETLNKLRLILIATDNQNLMKAMVKVMFDFSDALKENNLLIDEELKCNTRQRKRLSLTEEN